MAARLGLRHFTQQRGENPPLKNWTRMETIARWASYFPAVFFGRVIQVSADSKEMQELNPSRVKPLLLLGLVGGAAVYLGLQQIALIAAAVMVVASILGVVTMGYSDSQAAYNEAYVDCVVEQRKKGIVTDKAVLAEEVNRYAQKIADAATTGGWFSGAIESALNEFQKQCAEGTTVLIQYLLGADPEVFKAVYKKAGNLLMGQMTSREMATAVMGEVVKAAPASGDQEIRRYMTFIERFARRCQYFSVTDWISEICDAAKENPVALGGVLTGLAAREGSMDRALTRGFTVSDLGRVINRGILSIETLGNLAVALSAKATDPKFSAYAGLKKDCEARLSDTINGLKHAPDYEGDLTPQTEAFMRLSDPQVQAKWIEVSLGAYWLGELGARADLEVAVQALAGNLAQIDAGFLTGILRRLVKNSSYQQAEKVVILANTSTLQSWSRTESWSLTASKLDQEQIALVELLRVKHGLEAGNIALVIGTNPELYVADLLEQSVEQSGNLQQRMIWSTFAGKGVYPDPKTLSPEVCKTFFGALPKSFKAAITGIPASLEASQTRLMQALAFLDKASNQEAMEAFVAALDNGQKAILGHYLSTEEQAKSPIAAGFTDQLEAWKALGSVGSGTFWNGWME